MAVKVNKRKKKHVQVIGEDGDGGNDEVPAKVAKKMKKGKTLQNSDENQAVVEEMHELHEEERNGSSEEHYEKQEESNECLGTEVKTGDEEPENHDSGFDPGEETPLTFSKDINMASFRAKLRGSNFIADLRQFLHLARSRPDIVVKYIEKRGKPLELVEALEGIDKANALHVAYLCDALQLVVMEILTNQKKHIDSALLACRFFLKTHASLLELLLKSAQLQHRRIALKLMTAVVCVEPQLGRQLLSSYDMLSNVKTIENFLSHSKQELHAKDTVRKCFVHFVLAYLVDGNTLLIRNILDRGTLIRALASGMLYDDYVTVCVILSTLRKYVLECTDISKTKKVHVFDLECCKHFALLYNWHGPAVYAAKARKSGADSAAKLSQQEISDLVNPDEREAVAAAAHEFLVMLLSSRKFGIAFDATRNLRQKHNAIQAKIISCLYKPWCDERKTDLVVKILEACPDLGRHTMRHFGGIVNPVYTPQRDWVAACNFLTTLITTLHPRLLKNAKDKITLTDFTYWIKDICLPIETLLHITGSKILRHARYDVRIASNRLLLAMFTQYSNFVSVIAKREQARTGGGGVGGGAGSNSLHSLRRLKFDILNHILVHFPTMDSIVLSLYMSIQKQHEPEVNVLEHLELTLDLILIICQENRSFVNNSGLILDYLKLLRPLYASGEATSEEGNIKVELKAVKAILLLVPKALEPHGELYGSVLRSFIKAFVRGSGEVQREAGFLLHDIYKNTGLFDAGELEINLWLEALRCYDDQTVDVVTSVLIEVFQVTKVAVDAPKSAVDETSKNTSNLQKLFENIEQGLSVQAYIETLSISKLMLLIFKGVEIVEPLRKYLETVCLLMFHYYPMPEQVYQLYDMQFESLKCYMVTWLQMENTKVLKLENPAGSVIPKLQELQDLVINGGNQKFEDLFAPVATDGDADGDSLEIDYNGKRQKLSCVLRNQRMLLIYTQVILFMVAQLVAKRSLTQGQAERAVSCLKGFIEVAKELEAERSSEDAVVRDDEPASSFLMQLMKYIFGTRLSYINSDEIFSALHVSHTHYLQFLSELAESCNDLECFAQYTANYRLRLVKAVAISMQELELSMQQSEQLAPSLRLIQAFRLDAENCLEILNLLAGKLKYKHFFIAATSQKTIYYDLLVLMLQRLTELKQSVRCDDFMRRLLRIYVNFVHKLKAEINLEHLEEALYHFLLISHHYIPQMDSKMFDAFFAERKVAKSTVRLACLLLERDAKLKENFLQLLPSNKEKKELIYPLLKIAFQQEFPVESTLLNSIYQEYKSGFMKTIEKPQKAAVIYRENVETSVALIKHCMPRSECMDFCNKNLKFDNIELYQMQIINAIYKKAIGASQQEVTKQLENIFVNYINLQIQMLCVELKKQQSLQRDKLELFAFYIQEWLVHKSPCKGRAKDTQHDFSRILKSQQWKNFCKTSLKLGMQISANESSDPEEFQRTDATNGLLMKLLAFLCDRLYSDYNEASESENLAEFSAEPAQLFEMIFTHSKFFDIVLQNSASSSTSSQMKTQVLHLLYVLALKNPAAALNDSQIPVILGAYQARLSDADRYALALLQLYETHNCDLQKYRPFIWGESATAFYALRTTDTTGVSQLTQQETSVAQVMSLIDRQVCEHTIDNFPIWRRLNSTLQMPAVNFEDPAKKAMSFGSNSLERRIEQGDQLDFSLEELRLCPKRTAIYEQCYDPAFFIPLMNMCFAPESYAHPARPVQNGLLSIVFAALSSQDRDMRLAAGCAQLRYRSHFEANKFFERPLWIQTYENVQCGLAELRSNWMKYKRNSGTPRVPYISALFVAKAFNLTTEPTHLLYKPLTMYLRLKSSFNFQCIPEFNVLFYSPEVEHQQFRHFIVDVIRNGIKCSSDLYMLVGTHTFKVLMGFYGSPISTLELNLLILSVFSTCVKIPASSKIMIENVGVLPWLSSIIGTLEFHQFDVIEGLISIVNNLWYALKATANDLHNYPHICAELHRVLLSLLPHLSPRISVACFAKVLNILNKTSQPRLYWSMSAMQLNLLIECCRKHFPEFIHTVVGIRTHGGAGAESNERYCQRLHAQQVDSVAILALSSLRSYVANWWQCCCQQEVESASSMDTSDLNLTAA